MSTWNIWPNGPALGRSSHSLAARIGSALLMGAVGGLAGYGVGSGQAQAVSTSAYAAPQVPPCPMEDSPGPCYWAAPVRGNGEGRSFTRHGGAGGDNDAQQVTYWDGRPSAYAAIGSASSWCKRLLGQPAYRFSYQGAAVGVPDGRALYRELRADGLSGRELRSACRILVREYRLHAG